MVSAMSSWSWLLLDHYLIMQAYISISVQRSSMNYMHNYLFPNDIHKAIQDEKKLPGCGDHASTSSLGLCSYAHFITIAAVSFAGTQIFLRNGCLFSQKIPDKPGSIISILRMLCVRRWINKNTNIVTWAGTARGNEIFHNATRKARFTSQ